MASITPTVTPGRTPAVCRWSCFSISAGTYSRRIPLRPGQGRRGGLDPGRDRTSGQGAARSPRPAARARRPRRQRRRALGAGMGMHRQRALGRRARRCSRGERHRRRLQDGNGRRLGRPGHGHRPGHARRPRPGSAAAGPRPRRGRCGRIPRVRRQDPPRGRPRRAGSGQLRDRLRTAQPAIRRRRHAPAPTPSSVSPAATSFATSSTTRAHPRPTETKAPGWRPASGARKRHVRSRRSWPGLRWPRPPARPPGRCPGATRRVPPSMVAGHESARTSRLGVCTIGRRLRR